MNVEVATPSNILDSHSCLFSHSHSHEDLKLLSLLLKNLTSILMITSADKEVDNDVITFHSVFGDDDVDDYDNDGDDDDDVMTMMMLLLLLMMMMMTTTTMKKYIDDEGDIDGSTTTDEGHVNS